MPSQPVTRPPYDVPVMQTLDLRSESGDVRRFIPRAQIDVASAEAAVGGVIERVRSGGEQAVLEIGEQFDKVRPPSLRVPGSVIDAALARIEAGTYGDCVGCGVHIPKARLQATPEALRCIPCQEQFEKKHPV